MNDASYSGRPWVAIASYDPRFFRICEHYLACLDGGAIRCETFQSGQELLARLEQGAACQALLLDNALADMDTLTFCHRLQQLDPGCRPPLLLALTCDVRELDSLFRPQHGARPCAARASRLSSPPLDL